MPQIFRRSSNSVAKLVIFLIFGIGIGALGLGEALERSTMMTQTHVEFEQPVPFSHKHHVGGLGLDCRFCHSRVETSAQAGIPSSSTCMNCHSQIWRSSETLKPVRLSEVMEAPIAWQRVYKVPTYVYFNHSIHLDKGIGCTTCHGEVGEMPLTRKTNPFFMKDCLRCHRHVEEWIRPRSETFNPSWIVPRDQLREGRELMKKYGVPSHDLTSCYVCHR